MSNKELRKTGTVVKLFPRDDFGFIKNGPGGEEVYFRLSSVKGPFLKIGSMVSLRS